MRANVLAVVWALATIGSAAGQEVARVDVYLDQDAGPASALLYGCALPAPGAPNAGRLLPDLLRNGSFEATPVWEPIPIPKPWGAALGWQFRRCGSKRIVARAEFGSGNPIFPVLKQKWEAYHLALTARKLHGPGGLAVLVEVRDLQQYVRWNLGGQGNRYHVLELITKDGPRLLGPPVVGRIEPGRLYRIDVVRREGVLRCSLDGRLIHRVRSARYLPTGFGLAGADATAEYFDLTVVDPKDKPLYRIDEPAEMMTTAVARDWEPLSDPRNQVVTTWDFLYPHSGGASQCVDVRRYVEGDAGLCQRGIPVAKGALYKGRVALRARSLARLTVSLRGRDGAVLASQELRDIPPNWRVYRVELRPTASDGEASFCISLGGAAMLWVDSAWLARADAIGPHGLRKDVVDALTRLHPTVLRWPSGPAANLAVWDSGIGPVESRGVTSVADATRFDMASLAFGTDEFLGLCKTVGAEPMLTVNASLGLRPALYWLEYCNGAADTLWGKRRAANGHPEPYGVRFWLIADEPASVLDPEWYADLAPKLAAAMRQQDPTVRVVLSGGPGLMADPWDAKFVSEAAPYASHLAKALPGPGADLAKYVATARRHLLAPAIVRWMPAEAAVAARMLNGLTRQSGADALATGIFTESHGPSLLTLSDSDARPTPLFELFRRFREHIPARCLRAEAEAPLDAFAGTTPDGTVVRLVNPTDHPVTARVVVHGRPAPGEPERLDLPPKSYRVILLK